MSPIFDLHCHPALKIYLVNKKIWRLHYPAADIMPLGMHVDLPGMEMSRVKVIFCAHYIPEAGLGKLKSKKVFAVLQFILKRLMGRLENGAVTDDAYHKALLSMEKVDKQVLHAATRFKYNVTVARNRTEFNAAHLAGKTIVLHTLEGAHALGTGGSQAAYYIQHLAVMKSRGVCCITLSHFFPNKMCDSGGGIPPSVAKKIGYKTAVVLQDGLTPIGEAIVQWCLDNGMLICLVHSSVKTRQRIYQMQEERKQAGKAYVPLLFTHSAVRELAAPNMHYEFDKLYLPDINEIKTIHKYGGLVGLILMNYWLVGQEEDSPTHIHNAIDHVINTITFIHDKLGTYDIIGIGTDLDGFTQVPDDLRHVRFLKDLTGAMEARFGKDVTRQICFDNALRVLQQAWIP